MDNTRAILKNAFIDAQLVGYTVKQHTFSTEFETKMKRIIKYQKGVLRLINTTGKRIACIILTALICLTTVACITSYLTTELNSKPEPKPDVVDGNTFTPQNDNVTAKQEVNLRLSPTTSGQIAGVLKNGTVLQRTATSNKGWSRLIYDGQTVYAITSYLTTDLSYKPPVDDGIKTEFQADNEQVTAKSETNLRTLPSVTDSEVVYTLKNGEYLTRTGISANGWSRLEYNGQNVYAVSSYLTK